MSMSTVSEPVAIVGMACRFPGAENLGEYWNLIRAGRVATAPVSPRRWRHAWLHAADDPRAADFAYTDIVAHLPEVDSFPAGRYAIAPRRLEVTDPQHRLLIMLTDDAFHDAALTAIPGHRTDVYIGASAAEYRDLLTTRLRARQMAAGEFGTPLDPDAALAAVAGVAPPRGYTMPGTLLNMAAAAVSSAFDLGGASLVVDAACASALVALYEAVVHLRAGRCDLAVAGGVYLNLVPDNLVAFSRIGAVSPRGVCRPFDRRADGFVLGEGAGVVVLKRLADAVAAGDGVYAVIRGIGCANDGRAEGPMTPRLEGQVASLRRAYDDAGVDPATVGFVECHGTATPAGDAVELAALREVFGQDASAQVSSVKANIGHTMSAAGIAGLIKAVLVLRHGIVPPQAGCDEPDPALGAFRVSRVARPWPGPSATSRRAGVSSFGFGGTNVHVVLEGADDAARSRPALTRPAPETARYWAVRQGSAPAPPAGPVVASPLLAAVAKVSAHPAGSLRPDRALVDDLGFDSLMLVELEEHLFRVYPGLDPVPDDLMRRTTTIADLDAWLARQLRPGAAPRGADPFPEVAALAERLSAAGRLGIPNPYFVAHEGPLGATTRVDGTVLLDFSGYDYLGLATHPAVIAAATEAIARYGTSVSASRVAAGERPLHRELEAAIAGLLGTEAALTMVSGHATNVGTIGQLLRPADLALHDELAHDSILQGIRLSGARRQPFPHNDLVALDRLLSELAPGHPRVLVAAEGVYSMDGDLADLAGLVELRRRHGFLLYLDEAHSLGVLGATGRGALEHWDVRPGDVDILMGTLSKALASCGGYVAGQARLIEYLRYTTPGFVYSVGLPPAAAGAALAALGRLRAEPERVARLRANTELFRRRATEAGLDAGSGTAPVVPIGTGTSASALLLADRMRRRGVNVQPIIYPAVPDAGARLRFFVNTSHTDAHIEEAVAILTQETEKTAIGKLSLSRVLKNARLPVTRVAIIGGGIGGLTAANALSRAGIEVAVYEAAAELKEIGAGVALHPNAMKVLRAIGVEDGVRKVGGRAQWQVMRNWKTGRVIGKTSRQRQAAAFGIQGATAHRADLLDVLAGALPPGMVTLGKRCTQVEPDGDVAVARFADGSEIEADVIIGADGIHSAVRGSLFGPDAPRFTGKICYRSVVPAAAVRGKRPPTESGQWFGPHGTIVLYPMRGEELINIVCHYDDDGYRHESWIAECDREEVLERYAGWHESLLRLFAAAETWYKWALYDRDPIPRWTRGRVTVLGDAAHPMLPYLGQGACQAIEDGAVLATALCAEAADPVTGLARYERTRRPRASQVVLTARERGLSNHLTSRWAAWRRDLLIAWRRRVNRRDPEGRGVAWLADYDASSPDVLAT